MPQHWKRYIPLTLISAFSLLMLTGKGNNIFLSTFVGSILLLPIAIVKPSLAAPFLEHVSRKTLTSFLIGTFIVSTILSPRVASNKELSDVTPTPTAAPKATDTPAPTQTPAPTAKVTSTPVSTAKPTLRPSLRPTAKPYPTSVPLPTSAPVQQMNIAAPPASSDTGGGGFGCDCGKVCGAMSSCAEAQYQLNTCGCGARDGDNDGVACDSMCQ